MFNHGKLHVCVYVVVCMVGGVIWGLCVLSAQFLHKPVTVYEFKIKSIN